MSRQENRGALGAEPAELVPDQVANLGIQAGSRLVEDQQPRVVQQRPGDDQAPLHAARQLADSRPGLLGQLQEFEQPLDPLARRRAGQAVELRVDHQVLEDVEFIVQVVLLGHHAGQVLDRQFVPSRIETEDADHAAVSEVSAAAAVEHLHHRGLAGPVGAQQAETDALLDLEAQVTDGLDPAECLVDVLNAYDLHDRITSLPFSGRHGLDYWRYSTHPLRKRHRVLPNEPRRWWGRPSGGLPPKKEQDTASRVPKSGVSCRLPASYRSRCPGLTLPFSASGGRGLSPPAPPGQLVGNYCCTGATYGVP